MKKDFNKIFEGIDIEGMKASADSFMHKISPLFKQIQEEQKKLATPKSSKNTKWGGKNISINLIEDGRVLIRFGSLDDGEKFYKDFESLKSNWITKLLRKCRLL